MQYGAEAETYLEIEGTEPAGAILKRPSRPPGVKTANEVTNTSSFVL